MPSTTPTAPVAPEFLPTTPEDFEVTATNALQIAGATPEVAAQTASHGRLTTAIEVNDDGLWQVGYKDGTTTRSRRSRSTRTPGRSPRR